MTLSIRGDNHNIVGTTTDDIHVPIIIYRDTMWTFRVLVVNESESAFLFDVTVGQ
jgi:hypothetical protein